MCDVFVGLHVVLGLTWGRLFMLGTLGETLHGSEEASNCRKLSGLLRSYHIYLRLRIISNPDPSPPSTQIVGPKGPLRAPVPKW